jgi:ABC-type dipeptide/oligopeptide/nickel transport system ATPase subunit
MILSIFDFLLKNIGMKLLFLSLFLSVLIIVSQILVIALLFPISELVLSQNTEVQIFSLNLTQNSLIYIYILVVVLALLTRTIGLDLYLKIAHYTGNKIFVQKLVVIPRRSVDLMSSASNAGLANLLTNLNRQIVSNVFVPFFGFITSFAQTIITVGILLFFIGNDIIAFLFLVMIFYLISMGSVRKKLVALGKEYLIDSKALYSTVSDIQKASLELRQGYPASYFIEQYKDADVKMRSTIRKTVVTSSIPKAVLETLVGLLIGIFLFAVSSNSHVVALLEPEVLLPTGFALLRLIPTVQGVLTSYGALLSARPILEAIINFEKQPKVNDSTYTVRLNISEGELVTFIKKNSLMVIKGESGSGKSRLLRGLVGLENVSITGSTEQILQAADIISNKEDWIYLGATPWTLNKSLELNTTFGTQQNILYDIEKLRLSELIQVKDIGDKVSHGQGQRISILRAKSMGYKNVILDETLSGLDPLLFSTTLNYVMQTFEKIIIVSHGHDVRLQGVQTLEVLPANGSEQ